MNKEEFIRKIYSEKYINKQIAKIKLLGTGNKINVYNLMVLFLNLSSIITLLKRK